MEVLRPDLAVVGAGSGGLSVAAGAVQMGASVVLVEHGLMGGDCLNHGCVPSKATIAAARYAHGMRDAGRFGIRPAEPEVDPVGVRAHVQGVIAAIAPNDSVERFEGLGVRVIRATARFIGPRRLEAGGIALEPRRIVLATGSRPAVPPIPGIDDVPYLTNETVFALDRRPERLIVLGGGPIGVELAQAHRRLGAAVTLLERASILPRDDPAAVAVIRDALLGEGVELREGVEVRRATRAGNRIALTFAAAGGAEATVEGSHLLVAVGRRPNVEGLDLEKGGIAFDARGIAVDDRLRTSDRRVFAVGDVAGRHQLTHMAAAHASVVVRQALFRLPARIDQQAVPWVTYADPELAQVGAVADEPAAAGLRALVWPFAENDRAQAERATSGFVKVLVDRRGVVHGATIVGPHAGELIQLWCLVIKERIRIGKVAQMVAPYPTLGEAGKRAAGSFFTPTLFAPRTRRLVRFLARFG